MLVSLTFIMVTAGAILLFGEPFSLRKVVGLAIILTGIAIVSLEKGMA
jgi:drug/metabolite transporter (DMT)-like permease